MNASSSKTSRSGPALTLVFCALFMHPLLAYAFKMGGDPYSIGHSHGSKIGWLGDPVHEDMTWESIWLAKEKSDAMICKTSSQDTENYLDPARSRIPRRLSHGLCCHQGAKSQLCELLKKDGEWPSFYSDVAPIISGVRWNDDVCHMSYDKTAQMKWAIYWMNGISVERFNNSSFASHFHEQQFLHSMTPTSTSDKPGQYLAYHDTRRRIEMWAELAFKVAEGTISSKLTLEAALGEINPMRKKEFDLSFNHQGRSLGFLFTGIKDADDAYVRQMALGALMHTVQDSFSSSHVEREFDDRNALASKVKSKGKIRRFHTYGIQSPSRHGVADQRPVDLSGAEPGDFHPVAFGAQLLSCAASAVTNKKSEWAKAEKIIGRIFKKIDSNSNCATNAGRIYIAQGQSDMPDIFLEEGTVTPTDCR